MSSDALKAQKALIDCVTQIPDYSVFDPRMWPDGYPFGKK